MTDTETPIYIAHEDTDTFLRHITADGGDTTKCGLVQADFPDIIAADGEVWAGDKAWYYDHDRPDVQPCAACIDTPTAEEAWAEEWAEYLEYQRSLGA